MTRPFYACMRGPLRPWSDFDQALLHLHRSTLGQVPSCRPRSPLQQPLRKCILRSSLCAVVISQVALHKSLCAGSCALKSEMSVSKGYRSRSSYTLARSCCSWTGPRVPGTTQVHPCEVVHARRLRSLLCADLFAQGLLHRSLGAISCNVDRIFGPQMLNFWSEVLNVRVLDFGSQIRMVQGPHL